MTLAEFRNTLKNPEPPRVSVLLQALWHDARGEWEKAHNLAQEINTNDGSWIHAYLHRKEGDRSNAQYWYRHAHRSMPSLTLEEEWDEIATALLKI